MLLRLHSLVDPAWKEALLAVDVAAVCILYSVSATKLPHNWVVLVTFKHLCSNIHACA